MQRCKRRFLGRGHLVGQRRHLDREPETHVAADHLAVGRLDLLDPSDLDDGPDVLLGAEAARPAGYGADVAFEHAAMNTPDAANGGRTRGCVLVQRKGGSDSRP